MQYQTHRFHTGLALSLAFAAALSCAATAEAQVQTIRAFSAWEGRGTVHESGPNTGTFVGSINGTLFIDTEKGPISAGLMVCPAMLEIDLLDATQRGRGTCTISGDDGAKVFAEWTCQGVHLVGCDGEFKLTGGTGRMEGVTGTSALMVRSTSRVLSTEAMLEGSASEIGTGLLLLEELTYSLPKSEKGEVQ